MHFQITSALLSLESETGIRVLCACESGSRAWGFASPDSDWDVRFFFVEHEDRPLRALETGKSTLLLYKFPGNLHPK